MVSRIESFINLPLIKILSQKSSPLIKIISALAIVALAILSFGFYAGYGVKYYFENRASYSTLEAALMNNDTKKATNLFAKFPLLRESINVSTHGPARLLHIVAQRGSIEQGTLLVANNINVNAEGRSGTPLYNACKAKKTEFIRWLLTIQNINVNFSGFAYTPFDFMIDSCQISLELDESCFEIMKLLIEAGAKVQHRDVKKSNLITLCKKGRTSFPNKTREILALMIEKGARLTQQQHDNIDREDFQFLQSAAPGVNLLNQGDQ